MHSFILILLVVAVLAILLALFLRHNDPPAYAAGKAEVVKLERTFDSDVTKVEAAVGQELKKL